MVENVKEENAASIKHWCLHDIMKNSLYKIVLEGEVED